MNQTYEEEFPSESESDLTTISRRLPNILITGTPGTGKTTHCDLLISSNPTSHNFTLINIGEFVKENECHQGWDEDWKSFIVDDDKLLDSLESHLTSPKGGIILDWHSSSLFPETWFDLIIVLRTPHTQLWDRLERRGYGLEKIQENNMAEIMGECWNEAISNFDPQLVIELQSDQIDSIEENVNRIHTWIENWIKDHPST
ncbi:AAA domain-containing protein [Melampsora americana]|nr:AAA domain-containing protein [Melampsora americana]